MHTRKFVTGIVAVLATLAVFSGNALSAPEDDYKTGAASFVLGDFVGAMPMLRKSAEAGYAPAQAMYGQLLLGTAQEEEAVKFFKKSADQKNIEGQFYYGTSLLTGEGTKKIPEEGIKWILLSAEQGLKDAENQMALIAAAPLYSSILSDAEAQRWLKKSADNEFLPAIVHLVVAYRTGTNGFVVDNKIADEYQAKANKIQGINDTDTKRKRRGAKK